jgi:hypothetical protein
MTALSLCFSSAPFALEWGWHHVVRCWSLEARQQTWENRKVCELFRSRRRPRGRREHFRWIYVSAQPHSASCLGKGLDCSATLVEFPGSFEPAASWVISGLPLFLHSRLATVDESPASDSNVSERQQAHREDWGCALAGNPLHDRGELVVSSRRSGMHEMDKCEAVCFRARQNPSAVRSKDFLNSAGKLKVGPCGGRVWRNSGCVSSSNGCWDLNRTGG